MSAQRCACYCYYDSNRILVPQLSGNALGGFLHTLSDGLTFASTALFLRRLAMRCGALKLRTEEVPASVPRHHRPQIVGAAAATRAVICAWFANFIPPYREDY